MPAKKRRSPSSYRAKKRPTYRTRPSRRRASSRPRFRLRRVLRTPAAKVVLTCLAALIILGPLVFARLWVHSAAVGSIYSAAKVPSCRVALILGARVHKDGSLSKTLKSRVDTGIDLYRSGKAQKLLMSGDNRFIRYNEPRRMREYAIAQGVPPEDVAMDFAGRRTYDSIYRARVIFGQSKLIVVTQRFHMDRALFLCKELGVTGYGVVAPNGTLDLRNDLREFPASAGALVDVYIHRPSPILGKPESVEEGDSGD